MVRSQFQAPPGSTSGHRVRARVAIAPLGVFRSKPVPPSVAYGADAVGPDHGVAVGAGGCRVHPRSRGLAVHIASGHGDGLYQVWGYKDEGGRIIKIEIDMWNIDTRVKTA